MNLFILHKTFSGNSPWKKFKIVKFINFLKFCQRFDRHPFANKGCFEEMAAMRISCSPRSTKNKNTFLILARAEAMCRHSGKITQNTLLWHEFTSDVCRGLISEITNDLKRHNQSYIKKNRATVLDTLIWLSHKEKLG